MSETITQSKPQAVAKGLPAQGLVLKNIGPYTGVQLEKTVKFETPEGERTFRLATYQAYNAYGLIGCEYNGILVLDEDKVQVLADQLAMENSGYFGMSARQVAEFERLTNLPWDEFQEAVNTSGRNRYRI